MILSEQIRTESLKLGLKPQVGKIHVGRYIFILLKSLFAWLPAGWSRDLVYILSSGQRYSSTGLTLCQTFFFFLLVIYSLSKKHPILVLSFWAVCFPEKDNTLGYDYCSHINVSQKARHGRNESPDTHVLVEIVAGLEPYLPMKL